MKKVGLGQTMGILANLGVVIGIAFLAYELRQNTIATSLGVAQNYSDNLSAINYFVASDAEIAMLIARLEQDPSSFDALARSDQLRLLNFWAAQLREWESAYNLFVVSNLASDLTPSLRGQIAFILTLTPRGDGTQGVFTTWLQLRDAYSQSFNEFFEGIAKEAGLL